MFCFLVFTAKKSGRNFLADLSKLYVYCPQWLSEEHQFSMDLLFSFWDFECKLYPLCKTDTARLSKVHFACPKDFVGNNWVFWIIRSNFLVLALWAKCFELFRRKKQRTLSKEISTCPEDHFSYQNFEKPTNVCISFTHKKETFLRKIFSRLVKIVLVFSPKTIWANWFFVETLFSFWDFECRFYGWW